MCDEQFFNAVLLNVCISVTTYNKEDISSVAQKAASDLFERSGGKFETLDKPTRSILSTL